MKKKVKKTKYKDPVGNLFQYYLFNITLADLIERKVKFMIINRSSAREFIIDNAGKNIFAVTFVKKDGSIRDMNCRLGVNKDLKGVGHSFDLEEYNLLCVYDMGLASKGTDIEGKDLEGKQPYRMININTLIKINIKKQEYLIKD